MPTDEKHKEFLMPQTDCKSHKSKLFHTKLVRNLLLAHINDLPISRAFNRLPLHERRAYTEFKRRWLQENDKTRTNERSFKVAQKKDTPQDDKIGKDKRSKSSKNNNNNSLVDPKSEEEEYFK